MAHSSQVNLGVSAIHLAARMVTFIEDRMQARIDCGHLDERFEVPHASLHVGRIEGGTAVNITAGQCIFDWELRHLPGEDVEAMLAEIDAYAERLLVPYRERAPEVAIHSERTVETVPALGQGERDPAIHLCQRLLGEARASRVAVTVSATEAGQFQREGWPTVVCGPGSISVAHQANEYIDIRQLAACDRFLAQLVREAADELSARGWRDADRVMSSQDHRVPGRGGCCSGMGSSMALAVTQQVISELFEGAAAMAPVMPVERDVQRVVRRDIDQFTAVQQVARLLLGNHPIAHATQGQVNEAF